MDCCDSWYCKFNLLTCFAKYSVLTKFNTEKHTNIELMECGTIHWLWIPWSAPCLWSRHQRWWAGWSTVSRRSQLTRTCRAERWEVRGQISTQNDGKIHVILMSDCVEFLFMCAMLWGSRCISDAAFQSPACELADLAHSHRKNVHELRDF